MTRRWPSWTRSKLTNRQALANALSKAKREGRLVPPYAEWLAPPAKMGETPPGGMPSCDKCDGPHVTDQCPWFKKDREAHPDASKPKQLLNQPNGPVEILKDARVVRQPADGSCLFHSLAYGLKDGSTAFSLRNKISSFIRDNPKQSFCDSPLEDWVKWDANCSVNEYAMRMASPSQWGGGIEMAVLSHLAQATVLVYEQNKGGSGHKRIGTFEIKGNKKVVRIVYQGGVHYDALELGSHTDAAYGTSSSVLSGGAYQRGGGSLGSSTLGSSSLSSFQLGGTSVSRAAASG